MNRFKSLAKIKMLILVTASLGVFSNLYADALKIDVGIEKLNNESQYQIGGLSRAGTEQLLLVFPISEIKFLSNQWAIKAAATLVKNDKSRFKISFLQSLSQIGGTVEDSDWINGAGSEKDVFSVSQSNQKFSEINAAWAYELSRSSLNESDIEKKSKSFAVVLGYKIQTMAADAHHLVQSFPSNPERPNITYAGTVLNYSVYQQTPYWGFSMTSSEGSWHAEAEFLSSPIVRVVDRDDHLLRSKLSEGTLSGFMQSFGAHLSYDWTPDWCISAGWDVEFLQASGTQVQSLYAKTSEGDIGEIASIDETIGHLQSHFLVAASYKFPSSKVLIVPSESNPNLKFSQKGPFVAGTSFYGFFKERIPAIGPSLGFEWQDFLVELGYFQGINIARTDRPQTVSPGMYSTLPIILQYKIPAFRQLRIGLGWAWNFNQISSEISHQKTASGISEIKESIAPSWLVSCEYAFQNDWSQNFEYFIRYLAKKTVLNRKIDSNEAKVPIDLSGIQIGARVAL